MAETKDIFISYGRGNSQRPGSKAFATRLVEKLSQNGYSSWFDANDIPLGVDFQRQIDEGIVSAHNFIFIISPHSVVSEYCLKEISLAYRCGKRIIPVLHVESEFEKINPVIQKINWVYMRQNASLDQDQALWTDLDDFSSSYQSLMALLDREKEYVAKHTELLLKALEWERNSMTTQFLLVGKERTEAEQWLIREFTGGKQRPCRVTDLQAEYICQSRKNAENLMTDAFICYDTQDKNIRSQVMAVLAQHLITTWTHDRDIQKGADYDRVIFEGIEKADNFLYFVSKGSVVSPYCLKELAHAVSLNKRIVPLLIEPVAESARPASIQKLQYIDFTDNVSDFLSHHDSQQAQSDFEKDIDQILNIFKTDKEYYFQHKSFLAQALKWQSQNRKNTLLLRGFNLENAETWLLVNKDRAYHPPTPLHEDFIKTSASAKGQIGSDVFISYSRTDADFARKLNTKLQTAGLTTWFDQESIAKGADFQTEIYKGIKNADSFVFVISPKSITSPYCVDEVEFAVKEGKRIFTLLWEMPESPLPDGLKLINWIDFKHQDFDKSFIELISELDRDKDHAHSHTLWQQRAAEWDESGRSPDFLLNATAFAKAKFWLMASYSLQDTPIDKLSNHQPTKKPIPTQLQMDYIYESERAILAAQAKERKNALVLKRRLRLSQIASAVSILLLFAAIYAYFLSLEAQNQAISSAKKATQSAIEAEASRDTAQVALSNLEKKEKALQIALLEAQVAKDTAKQKQIQAEIARNIAQIEKIKAQGFARKIQAAALIAQAEREKIQNSNFALKLANRAAEIDSTAGHEEFGYEIVREHLLSYQDAQPDASVLLKAALYNTTKDSRLCYSDKNLIYLFGGSGISKIVALDDRGKLLSQTDATFYCVMDPNGALYTIKDEKLSKISLKNNHLSQDWEVSLPPAPYYDLTLKMGNQHLAVFNNQSDTLQAWVYNFQGDQVATFYHNLTQLKSNYSVFHDDPNGKSFVFGSSQQWYYYDLYSYQQKPLVYDGLYSMVGKYSSKGAKFVYGGTKDLIIWDFETAKREVTFNGNFSDADFLPWETEIIAIEQSGEVSRMSSDGEVFRYPFHVAPRSEIKAISADGNFFVVGNQNESYLFQTFGVRVKPLEAYHFAFSPDYKSLATLGDKNYRILDLQTLPKISLNFKESIKNAHLSPNVISVMFQDSKEVSRFDYSGKTLETFEFPSEYYNLTPSYDWKYFAAAVNQFYREPEYGFKFNLYQGKKLIYSRNGYSVVFSRQSDKIAAITPDTVSIYDLKGQKQYAFAHVGVKFADFSEDGKFLVSSSRNTSMTWDLSIGKSLATSRIVGLELSTAFFTPNSENVVLITTNQEASVFSKEGRFLYGLGRLVDLSFDSAGNYVTNNLEERISIFNSKNTLLKTFTSPANYLKFSRKLNLFLAVSKEGNLSLYNSNGGHLLELEPVSDVKKNLDGIGPFERGVGFYQDEILTFSEKSIFIYDVPSFFSPKQAAQHYNIGKLSLNEQISSGIFDEAEIEKTNNIEELKVYLDIFSDKITKSPNQQIEQYNLKIAVKICERLLEKRALDGLELKLLTYLYQLKDWERLNSDALSIVRSQSAETSYEILLMLENLRKTSTSQTDKIKLAEIFIRIWSEHIKKCKTKNSYACSVLPIPNGGMSLYNEDQFAYAVAYHELLIEGGYDPENLPLHYGNLSYFALFDKKFAKSLQYAKLCVAEMEKFYKKYTYEKKNNLPWSYTKLALALLMNGNIPQAKVLFDELKDKEYLLSGFKTCKERLIFDLDKLKSANFDEQKLSMAYKWLE
jgi:hypothetical protein